MDEQIENLERQTFGGPTDGDLKKEDELLHRIREVFAEYLAAIKAQRRPKLTF
jgi:hypothetical protein